jgi:5-methylthioribose kinase
MGTPTKAIAADVPEAIRERVGEFLRRSDQGEVSADDCVKFFDSIKEELTPAAYAWVIKRLVGSTGRFDFLTPIDPRARAQQALVKWLNEGMWLDDGSRKLKPADYELLRRFVDVLRHDLAGADAPVLEQILADQIALAWVEVNGLTVRTVEPERKWDFETVTHYDKRRERATRRFHESIKLLHTIRQQAGLALQVNVNTAVAIPTPAATESDAPPVRVPAPTRLPYTTGTGTAG